ncbi:MAG: D-glycero-beta-D-manno-heptose 1,7-bisphosphate 7-phosphatase [Rhodospirillaceae bacterium]|nr:D-glycero-beta-D-manno-heptose 1,7-bisphosphate 7-phosphatase [Rhodospirillaceae bacterium]
MSSLRPVAFLDRDGTVNVERNYLSDPDEVVLLPGVIDGLKRLRGLGYALVVLTNQSGVARGYFDETRLAEIHDRLRSLLAAEAVILDGIYVCPHGPDDACDCRKPKAGLARRAAAELGLDLTRSVMIGDKIADVGLGLEIGARTVLVRTGHGVQEEGTAGRLADHVADDLAAAALWLAENTG